MVHRFPTGIFSVGCVDREDRYGDRAHCAPGGEREGITSCDSDEGKHNRIISRNKYTDISLLLPGLVSVDVFLSTLLV